jgi:hypothetical protein
VLARQVGRDPASVARAPAALVGGVGLAPAIDRGVALTEPPQRLAESVERLGVAGILAQRGRERVSRARPVRLREAPPAGRKISHRT